MSTNSTAKTSINNDQDDDDAQPDLSCGIGRLRTNLFGTRFANLYVFAICFALSNFFTSMVGQVIQVQLTSLERQFDLDNTRAGLLDTASRAGFMSTVLFAGHFAKKCHIPLFVGVSGVVQGLMLTVPSILQFVDPYVIPILPPGDQTNSSSTPHDDDDSNKYLCQNFNGTSWANHTNNSTAEGQVKQLGFIVLLVVQAVKGITDTFHSGFLPTLFMDDNLVDKSKMGLFLGIWQVIAELSGPIGKQINGLLTTIPVDLKKTSMDSSDERFVSAWWLAFLVFGLGTALFSLPVMLFPRRLISPRMQHQAMENARLIFTKGQGNDKPEEVVEEGEDNSNDTRSRALSSFVGITDASEITSSDREVLLNPPNNLKDDSAKDLLKDFPKALMRLLKKPAFVLLLLNIVIVSVPSSGISLFRSSYVSNEYNIPMSRVALVTGITTAVGHIVGTIISSWLSSKVTTKSGYVWIIASSYLITLAITPLYFVFGCGNEVVYGADGDFGRPVNNSDCNCTNSNQLLSCGRDNNNYLSPCYAGCTHVDGKTFTHCSLLNSTDEQTLSPGLCPVDCYDNFVIYSVLHGLQNFFSSLEMVPSRMLILRLVDPVDRGFATSVFMFSLVIVGIPAPSLFGGIIDGTCLIWDDRVCSLYDRDKIRYLISGIDVGVHVCVQVTCVLLLCILKWEKRKAGTKG